MWNAYQTFPTSPLRRYPLRGQKQIGQHSLESTNNTMRYKIHQNHRLSPQVPIAILGGIGISGYNTFGFSDPGPWKPTTFLRLCSPVTFGSVVNSCFAKSWCSPPSPLRIMIMNRQTDKKKYTDNNNYCKKREERMKNIFFTITKYKPISQS